MKTLYILSKKEIINEIIFDELLKLTSPSQINYINSKRNQKSKENALYGALLLQYAILRKIESENQINKISLKDIRKTIKTPEDILIEVGKSGKLEILNKNIFFNISHSEDYIVLVLSKNPIGIDLQKIKEIPIEKLVNRFFTKEEKEVFKNSIEDQKQAFFFSTWCKKEAYGKLIGTGISEEVMKFDTRIEYNGIYRWEEYPYIEGYCIMICERLAVK